MTTFQGAGVLNGDLTPECAAALAAVLDALSARPARKMTGPGSSGTTTRSRRRCAAWSRPACCRSGPGSRCQSGDISLADLLRLDGSSALQEQWTAQVRAAVGRAPGRRLRRRQRRRGLAGRGRRRGDRVRRGNGPGVPATRPDALETSDAVKLSSCPVGLLGCGGECSGFVVVLAGGQAVVEAAEHAAEQVALGSGVPVSGIAAAVVVGAGAG